MVSLVIDVLKPFVSHAKNGKQCLVALVVFEVIPSKCIWASSIYLANVTFFCHLLWNTTCTIYSNFTECCSFYVKPSSYVIPDPMEILVIVLPSSYHMVYGYTFMKENDDLDQSNILDSYPD